MQRSPTSGISLAALGLAVLLGCLREEAPSAAPEPADPLLRCQGEAPYAPGTMEGILATLAADPQAYCDQPDVPAGPTFSLPTGEGGDPVRVRAHVLDARCRLVTVVETTAVLPEGKVQHPAIWETRDSAGNLLPTGEYYVNSVITWKGGRADTVYRKVGMITRAHCRT